MIVFICTAGHQYTLRDLLEHRGSILTGKVAILSHADFLSWRTLPGGNYIISDLERRGPVEREALALRLAQLRERAPGIRVLNDPVKSLGRVDLLTRLHAEGINRFRIFRADDLPDDLEPTLERPVFLRVGEDHVGPRSRLLTSRSELDRATADLLEGPERIALSDLVVTEYVDVRNTDGYHERYSVFRVGDRVFSTYYDVSRGWVNKGDNRDFVSASFAREEAAFVRDNPHGEMLRPIFDLAGITYGRVDYGFLRDDPDHLHPQIFEINTNPMIETPDRARPEWAVAAARFNALYEEAMLHWDGDGAEGGDVTPTRLRLPPGGMVGRRLSRQVPFGLGRRLLRVVLRALGHLEWETRITGPLARLRCRFRNVLHRSGAESEAAT